MSHTKQLYKNLVPDLKKKFSYQNDMEVPKITKVNISVGVKATENDNKFMTYLVNQVSGLAGQKAVLTKSKKAIATFKLRENVSIGAKVTLRGKKMYEFFDRLVYIALPRIRDFRGLSSKGFNESNHYSFGIKEHNIFLEVDLDNILKVFGMNITIATSAKNQEEASYLLKKLNLPIK